jgi:ferritin
MIPDKMQKALNGQVNEEIFSAYLYLSMAAYFDDLNLPGFAGWMRVQAQEEMVHAMKFCSHITERGGRVLLAEIKAPQTEWDSPLAAFQDAYKHEQHITGCIHRLVELATAEKDHAAGPLLQWFVSEQVEEEASADTVVQQLRRIGDSPNGLFMLDRQLGARTFGGD